MDVVRPPSPRLDLAVKRSPLKRKKGLTRKASQLSPGRPGSGAGTRSGPKRSTVDRTTEPGREEWKTTRRGRCAICGRSQLILRHHVVYEQHVRAAGGDPWDLRNAMDVGAFCRCHANHHSAVERIPMRLVPDAAADFAMDLFGFARAAVYFARYYAE